MGNEKEVRAQSLSQLSSTIASQLQWLDLSSAAEFLTGVVGQIQPLQERYHLYRDELQGLTLKAAAAEDIAALRAINDRLIDLGTELFLNSHSAPLVYEACTQVREAIAVRTLDLARRELPPSAAVCDIPMALFATGNDGRREELLLADQAYFFVYDSAETDADAADSYFDMLGSIFSDRLDEIGISKRSSGIMPLNAEWRGSKQQWQRRVRGMVRYAGVDWARNILDLIILSDARYLAGDPELGHWFGPFVHETGQNTPETIVNMARVASDMPLPKGILRKFVVEGGGEHKGEFNLKLLAYKPLVICIEVLAVSFGIEETQTLERLGRLRARNCMSVKLASDLEDAFHLLSSLRIMQQIKKHKGIVNDDNYINPSELDTEERDELSRAISSIEELQGVIKRKFFVA